MSRNQPSTEASPEAKRNKIEELKAQQDGLDIWSDIEKWAVAGYDSIPPEKFDLFKWYGLYRRRPNDGHFMIRIRVPGGQLTAPQAREVSAISREYGRAPRHPSGKSI